MARLARAQMNIERLHPGVAADDRGIKLEGEGRQGPALDPGVGDLRSVACVKVVGAAGELGVVGRRDKEVDDGRLRVFLRDDEGVREDGCRRARRRVDDPNWILHLDALRDIDERSVLEEGGVKGGELFGAKLLRLGHEVGLEQVGIFLRRFGKGSDHDALGEVRDRGGDPAVVDGRAKVEVPAKASAEPFKSKLDLTRQRKSRRVSGWRGQAGIAMTRRSFWGHGPLGELRIGRLLPVLPPGGKSGRLKKRRGEGLRRETAGGRNGRGR